MSFKSVLKPEDSIVAGLATVALVWGIYQGGLGSVASVHATSANHPALETTRKKDGYTALVLVAGVGLLARDPNIVILGGAAIIAMELHYRHAIMMDSETGQLIAPGAQAYQPAQSSAPVMASNGYIYAGAS